MEQNRKPKNRPYKYSQLIIDKEKRWYNGAKIASFTSGARTTGHLHAKNESMYLTSCTKSTHRSKSKTENYKMPKKI